MIGDVICNLDPLKIGCRMFADRAYEVCGKFISFIFESAYLATPHGMSVS